MLLVLPQTKWGERSCKNTTTLLAAWKEEPKNPALPARDGMAPSKQLCWKRRQETHRPQNLGKVGFSSPCPRFPPQAGLPLAGRGRAHLDVRVAGAGGAPDAGAALLLPVREELGAAQHRDPAALEAERQRRAALQPPLVLRRHRQHDRDAQVHHTVCRQTERR